MSDLEELANAARGHQAPRGPAPPPLHYTSRPPIARRAGWRHRSGQRSFAFQLGIIAWTAFMGIVAFVAASNAAGNPLIWAENPHNIRGTRADLKADAAATAMVCPGVLWFIVALPLGIAAVATYEGGRSYRAQ